jgi:hypothetical protein
VQGKGGGVPYELFRDPVMSLSVLDREFEDSRGEFVHDAHGNLSISTGEYGAEDGSHARFAEEDLQVDQLRTSDPLDGFVRLQIVRDQYWSHKELEYVSPPENEQIGDVRPYARMSRYVQDYLHFKEVNLQLLECENKKKSLA